MEEQVRVPAAEVVGVNCCTLTLCCDSRQMRRALLEFGNAGGVIGDQSGGTDGGNISGT